MTGLRLGLCLALATLSASTPATAGGCAEHFIFEPDARLGVQEIARQGRADMQEVDADRWLGVIEFAAGERPRKDGRSALAFVSGSSPMDAPAFGGVVWTTSPAAFGEHPSRLVVADGVGRASFTPDRPLPGCPHGLVVEYRADGTFRVDGAKVATVK